MSIGLINLKLKTAGIIHIIQPMMSTSPFRTCGSCNRAWPTWETFVLDPGVRLLGLQSDVTRPDVNLLVFEHECGSSISLLSSRLRHLLPEAEPGEPTERLTGTDRCRGHCLRVGDLEACDAPCVNARDRRLILLILGLKNNGTDTAALRQGSLGGIR